MPCYDGRDRNDGYDRGFKEGKRSSTDYKKDTTLQTKNEVLTSENKRLTAIVCALMNELESNTQGQRIITTAETNGKINIRKFFDEHVREDETRLRNKLKSQFSTHEINLIKKKILKT